MAPSIYHHHIFDALLLLLLLPLLLANYSCANDLRNFLEDTTISSTTKTTNTARGSITDSAIGSNYSDKSEINASFTIPPQLLKSKAYVVSAAINTDSASVIKTMQTKIATSIPNSPSAIKSTMKYFNKSPPKKRKADDLLSIPIDDTSSEWKCPNITSSHSLECGCDLPHTLRCNGDLHGLSVLAENLRSSPYSISLLDCSLRNVTFLSDAKIFENTSLHGLVISSGEIKRVHKSAFLGIKGPLQALGLPGNALLSVPWNSISSLTRLERLDLSNNRIKALGTSDLAGLSNLVYLELSNNQISSISQRAFFNLRKLEILKLGGNRLGDYPTSFKSLSQSFNLRELDLMANNFNGPLTAATIPPLNNLKTLNLNRNLIKSIQNKALQHLSRLLSLSLQHNQIDVLQDHAFYGLGALETLDLSYNGIVAISSASLQHLTRLTTLDLTHNFLRALTADLITPLPSLRELHLAGNDISIVAKSAMDGAHELKSLSMQENPLSCDCTIRSFAEWLQVAKIHTQELISATCVTPPRLEGAPLMQVPIETLSCDIDNDEKDNTNIIEHLGALTSDNNRNRSTTHIKDLSEEIQLHELHYSADYGLILTWILRFIKHNYMCDAIFVYKEENINEILIDNSPIHCESKIVNGQNTVSVIVPDSSSLDIGESYRFCLVMVQETNPKADLNIGCSNITKLQLSHPGTIPEVRQYYRRPYFKSFSPTEEDGAKKVIEDYSINKLNYNSLMEQQQQQQHHQRETKASSANRNYDFLDSLNKSFLPGLGLGILVTSIAVLIWGASRLRQNVNNFHNNSNNNHINHSRPSTPTATTCYAAGAEHIARLAADTESRTRYLKLQATTSL